MDATANSNNVGDENLNEDMNDTLGEDPLCLVCQALSQLILNKQVAVVVVVVVVMARSVERSILGINIWAMHLGIARSIYYIMFTFE